MKNLKLIMLTLMMLCVAVFSMSCKENVSKKLLSVVVDPNTELYQITDGFVESLQTTYESYGMLGGQKYTKYTKDGLYKVMPTGRLINVRIENPVSGTEYEDLQKDLKKHYKGNTKVNDVYICGGGTIMIDCRN